MTDKPTTVTITSADRSLTFLEDYCLRCNPLGHHHPDYGIRVVTLTTPTSVTWSGGKRVICRYRCRSCGHAWQREDLWTARSAGFAA